MWNSIHVELFYTTQLKHSSLIFGTSALPHFTRAQHKCIFHAS